MGHVRSTDDLTWFVLRLGRTPIHVLGKTPNLAIVGALAHLGVLKSLSHNPVPVSVAMRAETILEIH